MGREGVLYMLGRRKKDADATDGGWGRHLSQRIGIDRVHVSHRLITGLDLETSVAERKTIGTAQARIEPRNDLRRIGRRERLLVVGQCRRRSKEIHSATLRADQGDQCHVAKKLETTPVKLSIHPEPRPRPGECRGGHVRLDVRAGVVRKRPGKILGNVCVLHAPVNA